MKSKESENVDDSSNDLDRNQIKINPKIIAGEYAISELNALNVKMNKHLKISTNE